MREIRVMRLEEETGSGSAGFGFGFGIDAFTGSAGAGGTDGGWEGEAGAFSGRFRVGGSTPARGATGAIFHPGGRSLPAGAVCAETNVRVGKSRGGAGDGGEDGARGGGVRRVSGEGRANENRKVGGSNPARGDASFAFDRNRTRGFGG